MIDSQEELFNIFIIRKNMSEIFFKTFFNRFNFPDGLNSTHTKAMIFLSHNGPSSMTEVSNLMQLEKGSFTPVAKKMVSLGYIEKVQNKEDKRIYELKLTSKGFNYIQNFKADHRVFIEELLTNFTDKEKKQYFDLLNNLNKMNLKLKDKLGIKK